MIGGLAGIDFTVFQILHSEEPLLLELVCEGAGGADGTDEPGDGGGGA